MAFSLDSITRGRRLRPPRIIIVGREKVGKSTFAAGAPSPIFIPIKGEEGIDAMDVARFPSIENYGQLVQALRVLFESPHEFGSVAIDSISALEPLVMAEARRIEGVDNDAKLGGGYGNQDNTPMKLWAEICAWLDALRDSRDMTTILIGHAEIARSAEPDVESFDTYTLALRKKARAILYRWSDAILYATTITAVVKEAAGFGGKSRSRGIGTDGRVLRTQARPTHPGGGRGVFGHLPYELPLDWASYQAAIAAAHATAGGDTEQTDTRADETEHAEQ